MRKAVVILVVLIMKNVILTEKNITFMILLISLSIKNSNDISHRLIFVIIALSIAIMLHIFCKCNRDDIKLY